VETFAKFEHEGWQRVAGKYDSVWASSTRQFIHRFLMPSRLQEACLFSTLVVVLTMSRPRRPNTRNIAWRRFFQENSRNRTEKVSAY
jgi:hypothetical protein